MIIKTVLTVKITKAIFLLGIFILPFVFWPWSDVAFEVPRVWFFNRWVEVLVLFIILFRIKDLKKFKVDYRIIYLASGFFLVSLISSWLGVDFSKSFWGNYYRGDGLITLSHLVAFSIVVCLIWDGGLERQTIKALSLGSFILAVLVLISAFGYYVFGDANIPNWSGAFGLTFGNPVFLAGYLATTLPFLAIFPDRFQKRSLWFLNLFIASAAIFFTKAWGGIISVFIFLGVRVLLISKKKLASIYTLIAILGIAISVFLAVWGKYQIARSNYLRYKMAEANPFVLDSRERIFIKGFLAYLKRPILGWGWANFDRAFNAVSWPIQNSPNLYQDVYLDKAHSMFLEVLTTTGIVGLVVYFTLVFKVGRNLFRQNRLFFLSFLIYLFHSQTNVISIAEEAIFWLLVGVTAKKS